ncbi:DNA-binding transcriptional regulator, MerR family [Micromonospora carbonacea]|uniref:DNA-binding transcriptional regulator, MerR family n=1 Tax=Micromonospora carbonacea TaxID=47853 RepID=A0A1C4V912_9ACTN|nr:DNA-binding transcriptional regulator, MerR family [Micromonospora carbonacea]
MGTAGQGADQTSRRSTDPADHSGPALGPPPPRRRRPTWCSSAVRSPGSSPDASHAGRSRPPALLRRRFAARPPGAPEWTWRALRGQPVATTLATHNLAIDVVAGVLTAMVVFARRIAHLAEVTSVLDPDGGTRIYSVHGELFFASSNKLVGQSDYAGDPDTVVIDMTTPTSGTPPPSPPSTPSHQVRRPGQDRRDHRAEPAQRPHPPRPRRPPRRRPLMATTGRGTGPAQHAPGPATGRLMQIGEAAERVGLSIRTIRHYEEADLIAPSAGSEDGLRLYTEPDLDRLAVVKRMKPLGFTVDEIRDLLTLLDALDTATGADRASPARPARHVPRRRHRPRDRSARPTRHGRRLRRHAARRTRLPPRLGAPSAPAGHR